MLPVELLMLYYDSLRFFIIFTVTKELNAFILSIDYKIISTDKVFFFSSPPDVHSYLCQHLS